MKTRTKTFFIVGLITTFLAIFLLPALSSVTTVDPGVVATAQAQESYQFLEPIPGVGNEIDVDNNFSDFVQTVITLVIGFTILAAIIMIVAAGFQYMTSVSQDKTSTAKQTIQNAVLGLVLALASVVILQTINPQLIELKSVETVTTSGSMFVIPDNFNPDEIDPDSGLYWCYWVQGAVNLSPEHTTKVCYEDQNSCTTDNNKAQSEDNLSIAGIDVVKTTQKMCEYRIFFEGGGGSSINTVTNPNNQDYCAYYGIASVNADHAARCYETEEMCLEDADDPFLNKNMPIPAPITSTIQECAQVSEIYAGSIPGGSMQSIFNNTIRSNSETGGEQLNQFFAENGIDVVATGVPAFCQRVGQDNCTTIGGITIGTRDKIVALNSACNNAGECDVDISGGTEWWNHGNGTNNINLNETNHKPAFGENGEPIPDGGKTIDFDVNGSDLSDFIRNHENATQSGCRSLNNYTTGYKVSGTDFDGCYWLHISDSHWHVEFE